MKIEANTPEEYIDQLPDERKKVMITLRQTMKDSLPSGFKEAMSYGMIGYVVPHSMYPDGYHCDTKLPLPFMSIASQKNCVAVYHMGIYADPEIMKWFVGEYPHYSKRKLDMGKSCIRFKKPEELPYRLIGELCKKMSPERWIEIYESNIKRK